MPTPISIPIGNTLLFGTTEVNFLKWNVFPTSLYFPWLMGSGVILPTNVSMKFPAFDAMPAYEDYTDWKFEVIVNDALSFPLTLVNGVANYNCPLSDLTLEAGFYENLIELTFENLNLLFPGTYPIEILLRVSAKSATDPLRKNISIKKLPIMLEVFSEYLIPPLYLAFPDFQDSLTFSYIIGGDLPLGKVICFFPGVDADFSTLNSEVIVSKELVNDNYGKLNVSLQDIESLSEGEYDYSFKIANGSNERSVTIKLYVLESVSEDFSVLPSSLTMDVVAGSALGYMKQLNIFATAPWKIISSIPNWLKISQLEGLGSTTINLEPDDTSDLKTGTYIFPLAFESISEKIVVNVTMNFWAFMKSNFLNDRLYFTRELDYLDFKTTKTNTYIEVTVVIKIYKINTSVSSTHTRIFDLPMFKGEAQFHPGTVVEQLMNEIISLEDYLPNFEFNYSKAQAQPAQVSLSYIEKVYPGAIELPGLDYYSGDLQGIKMLKGNKPYLTESQLSLLTVAQQEITRITPNSAIGVSFSYPGTPHIIVKQNNALIDDFFIQSFSSAGNPKMIFTYYRFSNDFKPGDIIEIMIISGHETRSQRYLVFQSGLESTFFFFENDNGQIEPFEFSGRRRINSGIKHVLGSKFKNLKGFDSKIDSDEIETININTGQLGKTEHAIVRAITKSLNVWVSIDQPTGPFLKVDATTTKFLRQDTSANEEDFDVEFNILPI